MANTVKIKHSDVSSAVPATLEQGELAINTADALLFWEDSVGAINSTHLSPAPSDIGAATAAQGSLADSAVQPGDLATVATSGSYSDLAGIPSEFTPTSHASTHATGGSDALTPSDIGAAPAASPTFTGVITVSAGTAAAPAIISGTGTSDTGVFWPAADTFAISTAGTERLRVDSAGHVAVNKTPRVNTQFEVVSDAASPFTAIFDGTASTDYNGRSGVRLYNGSYVAELAIDPVSFTYGLSGGTSGGSQIIPGGMTYADVEILPNQWVKINDQLLVSSGTAAAPSCAFIGDTNTGIYSPAADTLAVSTAGTERLRVDASGGVGIGTTSVDSGVTLDARGTIQAKAAGVKIQAVDSSVIVKTQASNATSEGIVGTESNHNLAIRANNTAALRVKTTGAVRFMPLASDPASGEAGDVYYNSSTNKLRVYNGTSWIDLH